MTASCKIRVHYPLRDGHMTLRLDVDWDQPLQPSATDPARGLHEFDVATARPSLFYKPCIVGADGQLRWAQGKNYFLPVEDQAVIAIYPHFAGPPVGRVTDLTPFNSSRSGTYQYRAYLPPGYDDNTLKRYPVLYVHDGQNVFSPPDRGPSADWMLDETLGLLDAMSLIDKVIVVGIYSRVSRMDDYTRPGYAGYGAFLTTELVPELDRVFRTLPGPANRAVMGASLGGLVSFYLAWEHPAVFGMAACMSSTFGYRNDLIARVRREPPSDARKQVRFYLDSGWPGDNYERTLEMYDALVTAGFEPGQRLTHLAFPHDSHHESSWGARSHIPFQYMFGSLVRNRRQLDVSAE